MSDKLSISQQNEIMNIPDYEAGIYSSFYEGEGISFEDEELGFEKVDNTLDSARRKKIPLSQTKCEFNVYHNTKDNIKTSYYFDNTGMNSDDCKKYKNFMNSNETIGREKNNIGKHGMGSKFNDYQHSKKGSTVVFSKYEKDYSLLYFNYKQMSIDLKKKNLANLLTRNSSTKTFKNLEEMLEFIEELYKDKDKLYSYNSCIDKNDLKNLINIKLKNNGTVFLYNTEDNTNNINNIYNQKKFKDKCNIIYTDYLNEGFEGVSIVSYTEQGLLLWINYEVGYYHDFLFLDNNLNFIKYTKTTFNDNYVFIRGHKLHHLSDDNQLHLYSPGRIDSTSLSLNFYKFNNNDNLDYIRRFDIENEGWGAFATDFIILNNGDYLLKMTSGCFEDGQFGPNYISWMRIDKSAFDYMVHTDDVTVENDQFVLSPNPATDYLSINSNSTKIETILIYDMMGQVINVDYDKLGIDISNLLPGSYVVSILDSNGTKEQHMLVKCRGF